MSSIFGTSTSRTRMGSDDGDILRGTRSADGIRGHGGDDTIVAWGGNDKIDGGTGNDHIWGGTGMDAMVGGAGRDTFGFIRGDSGRAWENADMILDFNTKEDSLIFEGVPKGNKHNYREFEVEGSIGSDESEYNYMLKEAQKEMSHNRDVAYVFGTNGKDGYLFVDFNHDGHIDSGIELKHLDSIKDFSYHDLV